MTTMDKFDPIPHPAHKLQQQKRDIVNGMFSVKANFNLLSFFFL